MPLLRPDSAEDLERRMTIALRNGRGWLPRDGHVRVGSSGKISLRAYRVRFIPVNGSGSRHSGSAAQWHNRTYVLQPKVHGASQPLPAVFLIVSYSASFGSGALRLTLQLLCWR